MNDTIIEKLKSEIEEVASIQDVYDYVPKEITKFPSVTIQPNGWQETYLNLRDTRRVYTFLIRVYINIEEVEQEAQKRLRDIADDIINKLDSNPSLDGTIDFSNLTTGAFAYGVRQGTQNICTITYSATTRHNRY